VIYPLVELKNISKFINGFAFKPEHWGENGKPIIRIQNLTNTSKPFNRTTIEVDEKYFVKSGDILVSWSATLDVFEWKTEDALLNQHIFKVVPDYKIIDKRYFKYALKESILSMLKFTRGSTMKHINRGDFLATKIPLPPLETQKQIALVLETVDQLRKDCQQVEQELNALAQSVFLEMLGDPVINPKKWQMTTVGDVVSIIRDGPHVSPNYSETGYPILSTRNIRPSQLILNDVKFVSEETYNALTSRFKPQKGDVLLTKGGTTGYAKHVDFDWPFAIWVHLACLRPNDKILPEFLESVLNTPNCYKQSQMHTRGIANKDLGLTRIIKINFALPPLALQKKFITIKNEIDTQLNLLKDKSKYHDDLFNALLQKAFKGELELKSSEQA